MLWAWATCVSLCRRSPRNAVVSSARRDEPHGRPGGCGGVESLRSLLSSCSGERGGAGAVVLVTSSDSRRLWGAGARALQRSWDYCFTVNLS